MTTATRELTVHLPTPHPEQQRFIASKAKRKVIRAGRRGGKTVGAAVLAVQRFLDGQRVLYAAPTEDQTGTFWFEVKKALQESIDAGVFVKNETMHFVELPRTKQRIRAKTAYNADTLRGDYADLLILDEWQLMNEDAWELVGTPMLLDNNGDAVFIYTPPSLHTVGVSKARDPRHASKMFKAAEAEVDGRWEAFHFRSYDNPYISSEALADITKDMTQASHRQEILAEDSDDSWIGLVYKAFNQQTCVVRRFPVPLSWLIFTGHDFGGSNAAAMFYAQDPATGFFYAFHEYWPRDGRSTSQHVQAFKEITKGYTVIKRAGGSHQETEIRQGYTAHGWPIQEPKIHLVKPGIDKVIGLHELNKLFVFEDLYQYLYEKSTYSWKIDEQNRVTGEIDDKSKYHLLDAERGILSDFTPETVVKPGPRVVRYR